MTAPRLTTQAAHLRRALRGYDPGAVDQLLTRCNATLEDDAPPTPPGGVSR